MKLSAVVLVSVNLVAASQVAAVASEGDTASFLQDSLSSLTSSKAPARSSRLQARKVSMSADLPARVLKSKANSTMLLTSGSSVKIRPFVPGRHLPSEVELAAAREARIATKQQQLNSSLALKAQAATRAIPGFLPTLPGQIAQLPGNASMMPQLSSNAGLEALQSNSQPRMAGGTNVPPLPMLTNYEQAQLNRAVEENMPENCYAGSNGEMRASEQGNPGLTGAGPPPFPLSLLPTGQMQKAMGSRSHKLPLTAQAKFGSWHGDTGAAQAAFHTYVSSHINGPMAVSRGGHNSMSSSRTGKQTVALKLKHSAHKTQVHTGQEPKADPYVASYGASYRRYPS